MIWGLLIENSPTFILAIPLLFAFLTAVLGWVSEKIGEILFGIGLALTVFFVGLMSFEVLTAESWFYVFGAESASLENITSFFRITFIADGFAVLATITISITAAAAGIYSYSFMKDESGLNKFYTLFLLTLAGVNGMVLTGDLFNLFVWFEVTSVASCALIAFKNYRGRSVEAALKYMVLSTVGGLVFLFSIGLLYGQHGVLNYALLREGLTSGFTFLDKLALGLIAVVFALKASSVPMHMWAPDAYGEAPGSVTPFIAVTSLGSLFVLFRLFFGVFSVGLDVAILGSLLIVLGALSMVVGVSMALVQSDLKRLIAYLSVSQVGYMMTAVGVGLATLESGELFGELAMQGGLFHMINDGVYKALLFLSAVAVVHTTGIRSLNDLGGLAHKMPYTTFFFLFGALSIAGIPPTSGFSSKLLIYKSVYQYSPILAIIALVVSIITLAIVAKAFFNAFLGPDQGLMKRKVSKPMLWGMGMLTAVLILFTLFPNVVVAEIVDPAIEGLIGSLEGVLA